MNSNLDKIITATLNKKFNSQREMLMDFASVLILKCGEVCDDNLFETEGYSYEFEDTLKKHFGMDDIDTSLAGLVE